MSVLEFFILSLSVWRFTHLIVDDHIPVVRKPREWIVARNPDGNVAYLVGCTWCSGVWVAAVHVIVLYLWHGHVAEPVALGAAWAALAALYETVTQALDAYVVKP